MNYFTGQTRLIYTWQTESPGDVDLHVHAIKNDDDNDVCTVFYANKICPATTQDRYYLTIYLPCY